MARNRLVKIAQDSSRFVNGSAHFYNDVTPETSRGALSKILKELETQRRSTFIFFIVLGLILLSPLLGILPTTNMRPPSKELLRALSYAATARPSGHLLPPTRTKLPCRHLTTSSSFCSPPPTHKKKSNAPKTHDRGPVSTEDTQTDFGAMDIFGTSGVATPATSIDACTTDGFHLSNGIKTTVGAGILLFSGEAFNWRPWKTNITESASTQISSMLSSRGTLDIPASSFALLDLLYPKPDLLIVGTGSRLWMLGKEANEYLTKMGVRVSVMDTGNASAAYNLLATERGLDGVGAALLPLGWKGKAK